MKQFIYRLAALVWILNYPDVNHLFDLDDNEDDKRLADELGDEWESYEVFAISGLELLDHIIDEYFQTWWDVITSRNIDMWSAPWADSVTSIMIAAQKGLIHYPETPYSWTESDHHHQWRNSLLESKGYVRD